MLIEKELSVSIKVKYYVLFFIATNYCLEESVQLGNSGSLGELVEILCQKYGEEFRRSIFCPDGSLKSTAWFILNGRRVGTDNPFSVRLNDGDEMIISSPLLVGG